MGILNIAPAERAGAHLLIQLYGPPRSGKTYTALRIARGMVGPDGGIRSHEIIRACSAYRAKALGIKCPGPSRSWPTLVQRPSRCSLVCKGAGTVVHWSGRVRF